MENSHFESLYPDTSRFVEIDGIRAEIVRRSAVISGNSSGGTFSIDVKNLL